jgi:hypothetical protein
LRLRYGHIARFADRSGEAGEVAESFEIEPHLEGAASISVVVAVNGYSWLAASGGYTLESDDPEAQHLGEDWVSKVVDLICEFGVVEVRPTTGVLKPTVAKLAWPGFGDPRSTPKELRIVRRWIPWQEPS